MSANVYLKNEITGHPNFNQGQHNDTFSGERIWTDGGKHFILHGLDDLPAEADPFVDRVTSIDHLSTKQSRRELGIYRHQSAVMEVEIQCPGEKGENYLMLVKGKNLQDVRELAKLFKTGAIRPTESFEGAQQGKSRVELQNENDDLASQVKNAEFNRQRQIESWKGLKYDLLIAQDRIKKLQRFAANLDKESVWPLCFKSRIANEINRALNDAPTSGSETL